MYSDPFEIQVVNLELQKCVYLVDLNSLDDVERKLYEIFLVKLMKLSKQFTLQYRKTMFGERKDVVKEKAYLIGLINLCFKETERKVTFEKINEELFIDEDKIHGFVLKAFGLGLLKGWIDECNNILYFNTILPRCLPNEELEKMRNNKYLSIEASEDESDIESEDLDNVVDRIPVSNFVDIAVKLEEKYATIEKELNEKDNFDTDETVEESLMQSQLIPKNYSPRLFLVRVKRGAEKEIALRIIHNKPNVCSIVAKDDGLKGYIYIQAFQKQSVLDSFGKTRGINKNKISIFPQEEMIAALTYKNNYRNVEFGRIRKGKYKGDLAQVIDTEGDMIKIRIIPRINSVKKLFNPLEYKDEAIKQDKDTFIYRRDIYVNGYLEKEVLRSTVDLEVEPNFEELESFNVRKKFESDEKVKVTRGELIGTQGVVQSSLGNIITIYDKDNDRKYEVQADFCDRYFNIGEEVCINNENGVITNIKNNLYYIAIKNFSEEIKATTDQIKKPIPVFREFKKKGGTCSDQKILQ
ncbi:PREDICTED: transcription elongation factor spt5-like [Polistes dominula]|uniref:Transcription elongation factor spt5-like n=1 Tax=Polistes dominula TaxID=743375 RepID=A0ABM1JAB3_POLDO|nr:PREDICTED: transcription elongation factor spt5-like [Polistes dominula]